MSKTKDLKIIRITTAPISLNVLLPGQMRYMREQGMDVLMVSSDGPELKEVIEREGCRHAIIPMTRRISPWQDLLCLFHLIRLFKREMPDIVHSHTPKAGLLSMLAAMFAGINTRIHTVSGLRFVSESGFNRFLLLSMERLTAVAATHILVNGKSLQEKLIKDRISKSFKISLLGAGSSNGINLDRFTLDNLTPEVMDGVKKSIQFAPRLKYIICIGRIVEDKGINELVDVFLELNQIDRSLRLLLVGSYEDDVDPVMRSTKRKISTNPNILVTGWTSNVPYYLSLATLLVHPSHREGFPNALLQAGAMGCPIVCSEIAGNIDIVENQIGGLTFKVKNRQSLKNVLLIALSDDLQMQRYAAALKIIVVEKFNQPAFWKLLLQKYHSILDSK